jgi:hypothetical protein
MRESLNRGLLLGSIDFKEGPFDSLSKLIGKELTKGNDHINYFGMHMRKIKQGP